MTTRTFDLTRFAQMVEILDSLAQRRSRQGSAAEARYYELLAGYYGRALHAREQGQALVAHSLILPSDLFHALGLVPFCMEAGSSTLMLLLQEYEELLNAADAYGLKPFICSVHRSLLGGYARGWLPPPDAVIWSRQVCENIAMAGAGVANLCDCPGFHVDHPFAGSPRELRYYAGELAGMVQFLEDLTGRRMEPEKLSQAVRLSGEQIALQREIYRLSQAVPSPAANRRSAQLQAINWLYMGTPEGVEFCHTVLREMQAQADQSPESKPALDLIQGSELAPDPGSGPGQAPIRGQALPRARSGGPGATSRERYRLLGLFSPPIHGWKVLDWMQQEHGATLVAQPCTAHWGEWQPDPADPYLSIAQRSRAVPFCWTMHGPLDEAVIQKVLNDARDFQVDGVVYWASIGCSHGCAAVRRMKDAFTQELGLPFLVVDMEYADPTIVPHHEIMERLEGFFEMLEELPSKCR